MTIREEWQAEIAVRDRSNALTLISRIANKLYPDLADAADRERRLLEIPEMARLALICRREVAALSADLVEWERKAA